MEAGFQEESIMSSQKGFYLFQEVVTAADVKPYVLRFWETEFDDIKPNTLENGKKSYSQKDIKIIHLIKKLLFDEKMSIPEAKVAIKQRLSEIDNIEIDPIVESVVDAPKELSQDEISSAEAVSQTNQKEVNDVSASNVDLNTQSNEAEDKQTEVDQAEVQQADSANIKEEPISGAEDRNALEIQPADNLLGSIHKAHTQLESILAKIEQKLETLK